MTGFVLESVPPRGRTSIVPRQSNEILLPIRVFFENFRRAPPFVFTWGDPFPEIQNLQGKDESRQK